jgi:hypothetical protein
VVKFLHFRLNGTGTKKANEINLAMNKVNISTVYNKNEDYKPLNNIQSSTQKSLTKQKNDEKFRTLLEEDQIVDLDVLKKLAWQGVPPGLRLIYSFLIV